MTAVCVVSLSAAGPNRRALIVGINTYRWSGAVHKHTAEDFENLAGASGDAIWLKSILTSKYGFRAEDVVVLVDAAATRRAILTTFRSHLIAKSEPGDAALFYFAGHGSQIRAGNDIEQTLVPSDSRDPAGEIFDIRSSELHSLFVALAAKTRNVTSILDSCYSDTAVRGAMTRAIRPDSRIRTPARSRGLSADQGRVTEVVRISAAAADQEAIEYTEYLGDGNTVQHGLMSYALFRELEAARGETTWRDVLDRTRTEVAKRNALQDPQLEAPDPDTRIFGGIGLAATEPYLLVTPERQMVLLNAGSMHSLAGGTLLDVYPPGFREFTGKPLAKLTVTNVADFTSEAIVNSGTAAKDLPEGARAVVRSRPIAGFRFRICFEGSDPLVDAVRILAMKTVPGAEQSAHAAADAVVRSADKQIATERPDGTALSPAVPVSDKDVTERVVRQLAAWARYRQLLTAEGSAPALQLKIMDEKGASPHEVPDGSVITIELCNTASRPYFTRLVYFSNDGSVKPVDLATDGMALAPGQCRTGGSFVIAVDGGRPSGVEFFKAFATPGKIDFEPFLQTAIRDATEPAQWSSVTKSLVVSRQ